MAHLRKLLKPFALMGVPVLFALLLAAGASAAPAAQQEGKQGIFGVVTAVTKDTVTIKKDSETVTLKVDPNSMVSVPGVSTATVADLAVGSRVAVLAERRADGLYLVKGTVVRAEAKEKHITVTVLEVSGKTVVAETNTGDQIIVELEFDLPGELKGQLITFIGEQPESNRFKAKAAMKLENVIARLDKHVKEKKAEADAERDPNAKGRKQQEGEALKSRLEANLKEQLDRVADVIAKAPEQAKPALEKALENFKKAAGTALRSIERPESQIQEAVERHTLRGTVEKVDTAAGQIVVRSMGDAQVTVKVVAATQIRVGDATGAIGDVRIGDEVEVRLNRQTGEAGSIRIKLEAEAEGTIKAIDATAKTLTLALAGNATVTLKLADSAKITVNDRPATLADLVVGLVVEVKYNARTMEARSVDGELKTELKLTVVSVNAQAGTLVGQTADGKSVTVKITDKTRVEARGTLSSILGLAAGAQLEVEINSTTGEAIKVKLVAKEERQEAKARGTVGKVDTTANKLTIRLPNNSEITVTITDATKLEADGQSVTLASLKEGDRVILEYNPATMVAIEVEKVTLEKGRARPAPRRGERATVEGTVTAVDPAKATLTVFTKNGETQVITVRPETAMAFNEKRVAALSELPAGAAVKVEYTEGNVAINIEAKKKGPEDEGDAQEDKRKKGGGG